MEPLITKEFSQGWSQSKIVLRDMRKDLAKRAAWVLLLELAKELAPFKFKPGRLLVITYSMGCIAIEVRNVDAITHAWSADGTAFKKYGCHSLWRKKSFPLCAALLRIGSTLGNLSCHEDDDVLYALDGCHIPLTMRDL